MTVEDTAEVCKDGGNRPIFAIAKFHYEEYEDGTVETVCLTQADTVWSALFFILTITIFFIIPLAILVVLYTVIAKNLMENPVITAHHNRNHNLSGSSVIRYRKQVVLMLGTVVLSFFLCLLPFKAFTLWIIVFPPESIINLGMEGYYIILYFCRIMLYLNSAINPILYNLMSSKFRDGFVKLLKINTIIDCKNTWKKNIQRRDTFNTTTSTGFSSSQQHTDSFWRRYSNRTSSQKNCLNTDSVKKEDVKTREVKIGEIISVENVRRNSMKILSELRDNNDSEENIDKKPIPLNLDSNHVYAVTLDVSDGDKNKFMCVPLMKKENANLVYDFSGKESFV